MIIGVSYASKCYLLFGTRHDGFVNMTHKFAIIGAQLFDLTGWSVSGAGDINNDTFADIIIGAPYAGSQSTGVAYVIYGKSTPFVLIDLKSLDPSDGYAIIGVSGGDYLGVSVSGAGKIHMWLVLWLS